MKLRTTLPALLLVTACGNTDNIDHSAADGAPIVGDSPIENAPSACPHIDLGTNVSTTWEGSTVGLPNFVESSRLEWGDAPDDSVLFTAPTAGSYNIVFDSDASGFGVSAREWENPDGSPRGPYYTAADCPSSGQIKLIDGGYNHNQPDYPLELEAGQSVLLWVSSTTWAEQATTNYSLRVDKVGASSQKRVFVTSSESGGNLGGLAGADATCNQIANDAGLAGNFVAWLSTTEKDAIDRLGGEGPWFRVDGEKVFDSKAAVADTFTDPENALWLDESGTFLPSDRIWTGTGPDGRHMDSIGDSCAAWTSSAMGQQARYGRVGRSDSAWTSDSFTSCDQSGTHLMCFEI